MQSESMDVKNNNTKEREVHKYSKLQYNVIVNGQLKHLYYRLPTLQAKLIFI